MSLEKLLGKVEEDAKKEIEALKKESAVELEKMDVEKKQQMEELRKDKEKELDSEREKVLLDYEKEKEFQLNMELLKTKKQLLEEASLAAKKSVGDSAKEQKHEMLRKKVQEVEGVIGEKSLVFVASGKKREMSGIFQGVPVENIIEKGNVKNDSFVIEGKKFVFRVSLDEIVDQLIQKEKDFFANLLFKK